MRANLGLLQQFAYLPALGTKHHELRLCQEIECLTHHFMLLPAEDRKDRIFCQPQHHHPEQHLPTLTFTSLLLSTTFSFMHMLVR
jgi:hypothetical protein